MSSISGWRAFGAAVALALVASCDKGQGVTDTRRDEIQGGVQTNLPNGVKFVVDLTDENGARRSNYSLCSGIRFAVGRIATAKHCVENAVAARITFIMARDRTNALRVPLAATGRALHDSRDLAVLFFNETPTITAKLAAVTLAGPLSRTKRRHCKATGRRLNDAEPPVAARYLESGLVRYKLPMEVQPKILATTEIATSWVTNFGDSGGSVFGRFLTRDNRTYYFRPIATNMSIRHVCENAGGGSRTSAPHTQQVPLNINIPAATPAAAPFKVRFTMSLAQANDNGFLRGAARTPFPAQSPVDATSWQKSSIKGCLRGYNSVESMPSCTRGRTELGAFTSCTTVSDNKPGRRITLPTLDGCNETACGEYSTELVTNCDKECRKILPAGTTFTPGCGQKPGVVCPKNAPTDPDSKPAQCFCIVWGGRGAAAGAAAGAEASSSIGAPPSDGRAGVMGDGPLIDGGTDAPNDGGAGDAPGDLGDDVDLPEPPPPPPVPEQIWVDHDIFYGGPRGVDYEVLDTDSYHEWLNYPDTLIDSPDETEPPYQ